MRVASTRGSGCRVGVISIDFTTGVDLQVALGEDAPSSTRPAVRCCVTQGNGGAVQRYIANGINAAAISRVYGRAVSNGTLPDIGVVEHDRARRINTAAGGSVGT